MSLPDSFPLDQTRIQQGGVMRCCLGTVATEYEGRTVKLGDKSKCAHCKETFTLVWHTPPTWHNKKSYALWKPDWQIQSESLPMK